MEPLPATQSTGRSIGTRRRRRARVVALVAGLTALSAVAVAAPHAGADPKVCQNGPCDGGGGDPTTTTPSTVRSQPNWSATVSVLDETAGQPVGPQVNGAWKTTGTTTYATHSGDVVWSDAAKTEGSLTLVATPLPASSVGFNMVELTKDGELCRSQPVAAVPAWGRSIHILAGAEVDTSAAALGVMAGGLVGRVSPDPGGAQVTIWDAALVPQNGYLTLAIDGHLVADPGYGLPDIDANFSYSDTLQVAASRSVGDPSQVMTVHANEGVLTVTPDHWTDSIEQKIGEWIKGSVEPTFRAAIQDQATAKVNANVAGTPEARWFASLGYTVSVRTVTTTQAGLAVLPAFCLVA